ncbi:MAG: hypothetical protein WD046_02535 [Paracoccaceae bacterium]
MIRPALALLLTTGAAMAETPVRIQSGEHETFTRLVLSVDPARDWSLTNGDRQAEFVLRGEGVAYNISNVFTRIPRDRLATLKVSESPTSGSLLLEFGCDCAVEAFAYQGAYVVLDIAQRNADELPVTEIAPIPAQRHQSPVLYPQRFAQDAPLIVDLGIESFAEPIAPPASPSATLPETAPQTAPETAPETAPPPDSITAARIAEAQEALLTQLTRAAEQGLIEFMPPATAPQIVKLRKKPAPLPPLPMPSPGLARQITASTVYDRDSASALAEIVNDFARTHCLDDSAFDFALWAGDADFNTALGQLHSAMVEERDRPLPLAAADLVRFYLRYGLGREARSVLGSYGLAAENPVLAELALMADGEPVPIGGLLDLGRGCGGAHELWRMIAIPEAITSLPLDIGSSLNAFASLPLELRLDHIGGVVATLMRLDAQEHAQRALDLVARAGQAETPALRLIRAEMLLASQPEAAEAMLAEMVEDDTALAPNAMLLWAKALRARSGAAPQDLIQSLAAAAFERRGTAQGRALRLAEIQLRAGFDGFDAALILIETELGRNAVADVALLSAAQEILANATPDPDAPTDYIAAIMRHRGLIENGRAGDVARREIARQLLNLAMPAEALDLLGDTPEFDDQAGLLAAQARLALFEPQAALDLLSNRRDQPAQELMAAAYAQLGQYAAAHDVLAAVNPAATERSDLAFLAGIWEDVAQDDIKGEARATLAAYMRDLGAPTSVDASATPLPMMPDNLPNTLEAARTTLDANRESRTYLQSLLAPSAPE